MTSQKSSAMTDTVRGLVDQKAISESGRVMADGMQAWLATATECQREMVDFISKRMAKDSGTVREMIGCRNPTDAMDIHLRWAQEMMRDYGAEMSRILAIYTRHAGDVAERRR